MKKRDTLINYFMVITIPLYYLFWLHSSMRTINFINETELYDLKDRRQKIIIVLLSAIAIDYFVQMIMTSFSYELYLMLSPILSVLLGMYLVGYLIVYCLLELMNNIKDVQLRTGFDEKEIISVSKGILLIFAWNVSVVYIQYHLNQIIDSCSKEVKVVDGL